MQKKKGISLIVLVITIIVMIILAAAIILSLNNAGIIGNANKAVSETNLAQMKELASMSWGTAYAEGARTLDDLKAKIEPELTDAVGDELNNYEVTVGLKGTTVVTKKEAPEDWDNVTIILDGVPIPKGFVASKATGENTKNEGFVIYEKTEDVEEINDENVEWAKRNINQYVWVPVDDFNEFKREDFGNGVAIGNTPGNEDEYWEVQLDETTNMPVVGQSSTYSQYITPATESEAIAMYESVKKYGGFYIARYEAGIDNFRKNANLELVKGTSVYSKMNKKPYLSVGWSNSTDMSSELGGVVEAARSIYIKDNPNFGTVSTLIYSVQWDSVLRWWKETNAVSSLTNSLSYGNYKISSLKATQMNENAEYAVYNEQTNVAGDFNKISQQEKSNTEIWFLTTGAFKQGMVKNIYDMAGNAYEWSMEGFSNNNRVIFGGSAVSSKAGCAVVRRLYANSNGQYINTAFRISLYIK